MQWGNVLHEKMWNREDDYHLTGLEHLLGRDMQCLSSLVASGVGYGSVNLDCGASNKPDKSRLDVKVLHSLQLL